VRAGDPVYRAYRFGNVQIHPNPSGVYAIGTKVVAAVQPATPADGDQIRFRVVTSNPSGGEGPEPVTLLDETAPFSGDGPLVKELSLDHFEAGQYILHASLVAANGKEVDRKSVPLVVSPRTTIIRPAVRGSAAQIPAESPGVVAQELGQQYLALEQPNEARRYFETALRENPKLGPAREQVARFEMESGNAARVIELLSPIQAEVPDRVEVLTLLGQAFFQQGDYAQSVDLLEKAIVLQRPQVPVLNLLANAQYRVGNLDRALELLERSLSLNQEQEGIEALLDKLRAVKQTQHPGS